MKQEPFNPFTDRLSRDIRNQLSESLGHAIRTGDTGKLELCLKRYRQRQLPEACRTYLEDRCARYEEALAAIGSGTDPLRQALLLWNLGLFFEVHEVLEHAWYTAEGQWKRTLQALIRAAGVYIKGEYGFQEAAASLARKAIPVLEENRALLASYFDPETLLQALRSPAAPPPRLL